MLSVNEILDLIKTGKINESKLDIKDLIRIEFYKKELNKKVSSKTLNESIGDRGQIEWEARQLKTKKILQKIIDTKAFKLIYDKCKSQSYIIDKYFISDNKNYVLSNYIDFLNNRYFIKLTINGDLDYFDSISNTALHPSLNDYDTFSKCDSEYHFDDIVDRYYGDDFYDLIKYKDKNEIFNKDIKIKIIQNEDLMNGSEIFLSRIKFMNPDKYNLNLKMSFLQRLDYKYPNQLYLMGVAIEDNQ
jgi:hypothetical protein